MKKVLIATGIAALAFVSIAGAQGATFTSNLTVGSTGAQVVALQNALISLGYNIPSIASGAAAKGYFGAQTKTAVQQYQAARGIPSTGFVGPLTRNALNGGAAASQPASCPSGFVCTPNVPVAVSCPIGFVCTPVGGGAPVSGSLGLTGSVGTISDVDELSSYSSEEVGEGQNDVKVLGMDVEASKEGDVRIKSVKVSFSASGNAAADSDDLDDYLDSVSIWQGSTKVGSSDAGSFNEDSSGEWSKTISLSSNAIIRADKTERFYVSVDAVNTFDSGDIDSDSWTVDIENIRFEDGSGVTTSDTSTGDIDGMDVPIDFASFSSASDTELKFSKHSSSKPASIVVVDDESNTDDVELLVGRIRLEGTSDVTIEELPITFTSSAAAVASTTNSVSLKIGGETFTETVNITVGALTGTVTFDNLDITIDAGADVTFTVLADINDIELDTFDEGDYLLASFTASNRDMMDVENEEGDQLTSSEKTGTATGEAQEFRTEGIGLTLISTSAVSNNSDTADTGTFKIKFKVTAIGDTMYLSSLATSTTATYTFTVENGSGTATTTSLSSTISSSDDLTSIGNYEINDGDSEDFELTITYRNGGGTAEQFRAKLTGVKWGTSDTAAYPWTNTYASDLANFKTGYVFLDGA